MWILRTGATWRDIPISYGCWKNTNRRFCRWRDRGWWETIFEKFCQETDTEWVMLDASYVKVHPHAAGAAGGNQEMSRTKGGSELQDSPDGRCSWNADEAQSHKRHKSRFSRSPHSSQRAISTVLIS